MKTLQLTFCVLGVLTLSACTNTWEGIKRDFRDTQSWAHNEPSGLEQSIGPAPGGYAGHNKSGVLKPPGMMELFEPEQEPEQAFQEEAPQTEAPAYSGTSDKTPAPVVYDEGAVSIFPVDGDAAPYADVEYNSYQPGVKMGIAPSGNMAEQIFFAYGSSSVGSGDRGRLHKLAANLNRMGNPYSLNVVGHASKRVDHVKDPIRKKVINFEMAQKRANAVTQALRQVGANPDWVMATSRGDEVPNPNPGLKTQEAADRRAEVYVDNQ
jgi:outer membrane protein OmpA-like peptidoglycan-associated protein/predicted small secreted protein